LARQTPIPPRRKNSKPGSYFFSVISTNASPPPRPGLPDFAGVIAPALPCRHLQRTDSPYHAPKLQNGPRPGSMDGAASTRAIFRDIGNHVDLTSASGKTGTRQSFSVQRQALLTGLGARSCPKLARRLVWFNSFTGAINFESAACPRLRPASFGPEAVG
jgi:hypothetical protein